MNHLSRRWLPASLGLDRCYQCGKCTAGCPQAERMNATPNRLMRWVQLGREREAMASRAIWQCVSCQTCSTRCPQRVDCAGVLDALRQASFERGLVAAGARRTVEFQRAFLENIRRNGRVHELELVGRFKTAVVRRELSLPFLFKDALLGPKMLRRGKLHFRPGRARDRDLVSRIFERCGALPLSPAKETEA